MITCLSKGGLLLLSSFCMDIYMQPLIGFLNSKRIKLTINKDSVDRKKEKSFNLDRHVNINLPVREMTYPEYTCICYIISCEET